LRFAAPTLNIGFPGDRIRSPATSRGAIAMVDLALKTLLYDRVRFAITVAGVAFAVSLVFIQGGLFLGILSNASVTIDHIDADLWVTSHGTPNIDFGQGFPETRVQRVRSVPGVLRADNLIVTFVNIALPTGAQEGLQIYGLEDFKRWNVPWMVESGNLEDLRRGPYIIIDRSATRRFGPVSIGDYREVFGHRLRIIGLTREALSFTTTPLSFMDYSRAQYLSNSDLSGQTTYILAKLAPDADTASVHAEIARRLPYNDVYTSRQWADRSRRYWLESTGIGLNMFVTVFLGCLVGIVVVAQTLYASTMDHIKEFGVVKAIGGSNADIYRLLAEQAVIAAVVGFVLGALPSFAVEPLIRRAGLKLIIPAPVVAIVFVGTIVFCLAAALISFRKVAKIDPALVFRG
jgi:putative ABC transport system permease protein